MGTRGPRKGEGGRPKRPAPTEPNKEALVAKETEIKNGYALIKFHPRQSKLESPRIHVGIHCKDQQYFGDFERGKLIPVPDFVLRALDNAVVDVYSDDETDPNTMRKKLTGTAPRYPYEVKARLNETQYNTLRAIAKTRTIAPEDLNELGL